VTALQEIFIVLSLGLNAIQLVGKGVKDEFTTLEESLVAAACTKVLCRKNVMIVAINIVIIGIIFVLNFDV
jgi:hypothetical protein